MKRRRAMASGKRFVKRPIHGDVVVNSLQEFLDFRLTSLIGEREAAGYWIYRGQSKKEWQLKPKLLREPFVCPDAAKTYEDAKKLLEEFKRLCTPHLDRVPIDEWEWLYLAQHHGLVTNLLDWSSNPFVGLFFAVQDHFDLDGAAWCHRRPIARRGPPFSMHEYFAVEPSLVSARIIAQSAWLMSHPATPPLVPAEDIQRAIIPSARKRFILRELDRFNINRASLFPGHDGSAQYLNWAIEDLRRQGF